MRCTHQRAVTCSRDGCDARVFIQRDVRGLNQFLGQSQDVLAGVKLGICVVTQATGIEGRTACLDCFLAIEPGDIKAIFLQQFVLLVIGC